MKSSMIRLGVNVDHVATLRQARKTQYPDPVRAALIAEQAGAHQITVHLREDRRHIQERDVKILKEVLEIDLNLEMANVPEMVEFALQIKPAFCCLVPEKRQELTTEGGLNILGNIVQIKETILQLEKNGSEVSLFIDANKAQIEAAKEVGAKIIELNTGQYSEATTQVTMDKELAKIQEAALLAHNLGIRVNAGHGLHYRNTLDIARIPEIYELNIGHAIIAEALYCGFYEAVDKMIGILYEARIC